MTQPNSPGCRTIEPLVGDGETITERGQAIWDAGRAMRSGAFTLKRVADDQDGQRGKAVDKLRKVADDTHVLLKEAGDMYAPTGLHIRSYGRVVEAVQGPIQTHVENCQSYWETYVSLPGSIDGTPLPSDVDADSQEASDLRADDAAKQTAYDNWEDEAKLFDAEYDTWEEAFNEAVSGIGDVLEGAVEDGWAEWWDSVLGGLKTVLTWVSFGLAILALVVGGPIIAILSLVVGLVLLAITIYQWRRGDASGFEVALAVVSVIPFGHITKFMEGGFKAGMKSWVGLSSMSWGDDVVRWGMSARGGPNFFGNMRGLAPEAGFFAPTSVVDGFSKFFTGQGSDMWGPIAGATSTFEKFGYGIQTLSGIYSKVGLFGYDGRGGFVGRTVEFFSLPFK
ncbi:hypothetical protein [uncultured Agrococcus sp.]|uniref:hypothetical protein n=1 Tax=uncultured Agrococcus sp. TaxID=382258 RepID=UPI0025D1292F|nr:hypothetical protein [uncultured Agrococcus sp.]